jgi:hypothetical protein
MTGVCECGDLIPGLDGPNYGGDLCPKCKEMGHFERERMLLKRNQPQLVLELAEEILRERGVVSIWLLASIDGTPCVSLRRGPAQHCAIDQPSLADAVGMLEREDQAIARIV